jgi:hypothetical protein
MQYVQRKILIHCPKEWTKKAILSKRIALTYMPMYSQNPDSKTAEFNSLLSASGIKGEIFICMCGEGDNDKLQQLIG